MIDQIIGDGSSPQVYTDLAWIPDLGKSTTQRPSPGRGPDSSRLSCRFGFNRKGSATEIPCRVGRRLGWDEKLNRIWPVIDGDGR
jgi:hypothetical protein